MKSTGEIDLLMNDFENGSRAFSGNMILGGRYIIGKNQGDIIAYS